MDRLSNNTIIWTEQINTIMRERSIKIVNNEVTVYKLTSNKIITQFINEYVNTNKLQNEEFDLINHVRLYK